MPFSAEVEEKQCSLFYCTGKAKYSPLRFKKL
jgi:hypothetical protein